MIDVWKRIEKWLAANAPAVIDSLQPPASEAAIEKLEAVIGTSLAPSHRESLLVHNGQLRNDFPLVGRWTLYRAEDSRRAWQNNNAGAATASNHSVKSAPSVRKEWWNRRWIPIATDLGGSDLCVDMDPVNANDMGQVIQYDSKGPHRRVIAPSFRDWLQGFAADLDAGHCSLEVGSDGTPLGWDRR